MKQQNLFNNEKEPENPHKGKMNKVSCPICGEMKNTFPVDSIGKWVFRLCLDCARNEKFEVDTSKSKRCVKCGHLFLNKYTWQKSCPVCFIKAKNGE